MNNMPQESQETEAIIFLADCCVFARFGAVPPGPTYCFACCFESGVYSGGSMFHQWSLIGTKILLD